MKLHSLQIQGFRKHIDTQIFFSDATFLIGENNVGKSTVLKALEYLLSDTKKIPEEEFFSTYLESSNEHVYLSNKIILTAEFRNLPEEAKNWRGFKGRIINYDTAETPDETGLRIVYRKTFEPNKNYIVELKEHQRIIEEKFSSCRTLQQFIDNGLDENLVIDSFPGEELDKELKTSSNVYKELITFDELYSVDDSSESWVVNPGGIPGNILVKLPKFLLIPAQDKVDEISGSSGSLMKTLNSLFDDVRDSSENFVQVQHYLNLLEKELDPDDEPPHPTIYALLNSNLPGFQVGDA